MYFSTQTTIMTELTELTELVEVLIIYICFESHIGRKGDLMYSTMYWEIAASS